MRFRKTERLPRDPDDPSDELDEEIRSHLEMRAEALVAQGLSPEEAREEALRRFGDVEAARRALVLTIRQQARRARLAGALDGLVQDARFALRSVRRAGAFTALSVAILGAAIGLTALTFAVTDHVLLRPLPFQDPSRVVTLQSVGEAGPFNSVSMPNWADWATRNSTLSATAMWRTDPMTVSRSAGGTQPLRVPGATVYGDFWVSLGARFLLGGPPVDNPEAPWDGGVVLSEPLWRRVLNGETDLGRLRIEVDGRLLGVAGVVAAGQEFPEDAQLWIPDRYTFGSGGMRNNINFEAIGRLRPGVTIEQAGTDLSAIARGIREADPEALYSYGVGVISLQERVSGGAQRPVALLMSAVLLVLLVGCANLAGLSLARARRRQDDVAVRLALGAGRTRLARQVLVEHMVLAVAGGALGVALAWVAARPVARLVATQLPRTAEITLDGPVLLFALAVIAVSACLTALGPVVAVIGGRVPRGIHAARGRVHGGRGLPGFAMVASELALATALLIGGGLLVRSFVAAASRPLGYDPAHVVTLDVTLTSDRYESPASSAEYWTRLLERLRAEPGVTAAAAGNWIPTGGSGTSFIELEGGVEGVRADLGAGYRVVTDGYLSAMGIALLEGRSFTPTDALGTERVGLVNRTLADTYWPNQPVLGKRIKATSMEAYYHGGQAPWITVIGVVGDVRHYGFEEDPRPELFVLYRQVPDWTRAMTAVVRTAPVGGPSPAALREVAQDVDPSLAIEVATLSERVRALLGERRLLLSVLWTFAGLAVLLACVGVYALISFAADERRRELAIRATLGASQRGIVALVMRDAGRVIAAGLVLGVALGYGLTKLLASLLLDVSAHDPLSYGSAASLLCLIGLAAALLPAWRAARADPLSALIP